MNHPLDRNRVPGGGSPSVEIVFWGLEKREHGGTFKGHFHFDDHRAGGLFLIIIIFLLSFTIIKIFVIVHL